MWANGHYRAGILSKSVKRLRRYDDEMVFKMAAVRHFVFLKFKCFDGRGH